jgi:signal transduction histidine kinase
VESESNQQPMPQGRNGPIVSERMLLMRRLVQWFTRSGFDSNTRAPMEMIVLRTLGLGYLALFIGGTVGTKPHPAFAGKGLVVTIAMVAIVACVVVTMPRGGPVPAGRRIVFLFGVAAASAVLASFQPKGIWQAGPYFVVIVAAGTLERVPAILTAAASLAAVIVTAAVAGHGSGAISVLLGVPPWFFIMRLIHAFRTQNEALRASQAAEATAAADAERGRLSREMHDVLAHSLSALALQLESARLLARDRDTDPDVTRALDQAHHLAAGGLDEARRAIAAARGEELPGPERLHALAEAFEEQSGIPAHITVTGDPRDLPPDARLAIYRTAQEALTNIRRHATPERVELRLEYSGAATVFAVEDRAAPGTPPPAALHTAGGGFGLSGMRERAELLGGRLIAEPTATGFRVELSLPNPSADAPLPETASTTR